MSDDGQGQTPPLEIEVHFVYNLAGIGDWPSPARPVGQTGGGKATGSGSVVGVRSAGGTSQGKLLLKLVFKDEVSGPPKVGRIRFEPLVHFSYNLQYWGVAKW